VEPIGPRAGALATLSPSSSGPRRGLSRRRFSSATRGPDNKDIHYTRRGFFSARNERSACFAGSSLCLFPERYPRARHVLSSISRIRSSFRRASAIRACRSDTRLKCNLPREERAHGGTMTEPRRRGHVRRGACIALLKKEKEGRT